ncbi:DNA alkylation repair protein [bacterium]|nr:DNA alkylation repair protein [bacterium]
MGRHLNILRQELKRRAKPKKAIVLRGFFKTGAGQYAEKDIFIGVPVPELRLLVKQHLHLSLPETELLIQSKIHEERLLGLLLLVAWFQNGDAQTQKQIFECYVRNLATINNWDLIDLTTDRIIGEYLHQRNKKPIYTWVKSKNLWKRRVAMLATYNYIKKGEFIDALKIADQLLHDKEDLIQKSVGWMLREIGKRDQAVEEAFLKLRCKHMPRTMLRYAIERFPENLRKAYLNGVIGQQV